MSLHAMTNAALARRSDYPPRGRTPRSPAELAEAADSAGGTSAVATTLTTITIYIPTEVLTLYVALISALQHEHGADSAARGADWLAFWLFFVFTPLTVWLVFAGKLRAAGKRLPLYPHTWPAWEMAGGTIAYVAWAYALPTSPFASFSWYSPAVAGIIVLIASTSLGLVAPLLQNPLRNGDHTPAAPAPAPAEQ
jgi:hypothetical protein